MAREHNWADNHTYAATAIHHPRSIDEVRHLVGAARHIRAVGTRHSFNGIADTPGEMIDLCALPPDFALDRDRMTVTVGANTQYGTLAAWLETQGCALHNMASLPHVTIIGATATGTHGSGDANRILSAAVTGLELVDAAGDIARVCRDDEGFEGMAVGLGAFGIVTRMTLAVEPSFRMQQDSFVQLPWRTLLADFDSVLGTAYSVSLLTKWAGDSVDRIWVKTRLHDNAPLEVSMERFGARAAPVTTLMDEDPSERLNPFGVPGPWSERLPHFRADQSIAPIEQIQSEYMVPRSQAVQALAAVRAMADWIDPNLYATEIRTMAADDLWLSPAHGHDAVAIHFTWMRKPTEVAAITRKLEEILLPLGGRPHWGKLLHADAARLAPLYPRMQDFRALATRCDPDGKFRNRWMERHVFG